MQAVILTKLLPFMPLPGQNTADKTQMRPEEPQATRRPRLGKSSNASGTRGVVRLWHAVERSRLPPQAGAGKRDSFVQSAD